NTEYRAVGLLSRPRFDIRQRLGVLQGRAVGSIPRTPPLADDPVQGTSNTGRAVVRGTRPLQDALGFSGGKRAGKRRAALCGPADRFSRRRLPDQTFQDRGL